MSVSDIVCVDDSEPRDSVAQVADGATCQGQGFVSKVDYKGQKLTSLNVKGQMKDVDKTTQQLCKEGVDSQMLASDFCGSTSEPH